MAKYDNMPAFNALPAQRQQFVALYCTDARFNGAEAARRAKYSPNNAREQAARLLSSANVKRAIREYLDARVMTAEEALNRLTEWGRGTAEPFLRRVDDGMVIDLDSIDAKENIHLIKEIDQSKRVVGEGMEILRTKIKLHDAMDAVAKILTVHGKLGPRGTEEDPSHSITYTLDEWKARAEKRRIEAEAILSESDDVQDSHE